jgi:hypothetical protein
VERTTNGHLVAETCASATYVYCVVRVGGPGEQRAEGVKLGRTPHGLWGAGRPRLLDAGNGYRLVVASAPLGLYGSAAIDANLGDLDWAADRAGEHEAIVEYAAKLGTVVPMKLFTLFRSDERAVKHVHHIKPVLDRVVDRIEDCEEWGLRVLFDPTHVPSAHVRRGDEESATESGTSFLRRKKASDEERRRAGVEGAAAAEELYERVAEQARSAHRREATEREHGSRVVLDAVLLVPRRSVRKLKSIVSESAESLVDRGFQVTLSGPWPTYSFVDAG